MCWCHCSWKSMHHNLISGAMSFNQQRLCQWFLWIWCQQKKQSTLMPTWGCWQNSRSVSNKSELTRIQHKSCFSMTMQGRIKVWGHQTPSQYSVGQCYPIHPTAPIKHTQISTYLEYWGMQSALRSFRPMCITQQEFGYMSKTRHVTNIIYTHFFLVGIML
jgi:hypothetical protein